jgi:hypothetical protein|eukprot:COSAG06_NODE_758_length_12509_cov_13.139162_3_plen_162_part_00
MPLSNSPISISPASEPERYSGQQKKRKEKKPGVTAAVRMRHESPPLPAHLVSYLAIPVLVGTTACPSMYSIVYQQWVQDRGQQGSSMVVSKGELNTHHSCRGQSHRTYHQRTGSACHRAASQTPPPAQSLQRPLLPCAGFSPRSSASEHPAKKQQEQAQLR